MCFGKDYHAWTHKIKTSSKTYFTVVESTPTWHRTQEPLLSMNVTGQIKLIQHTLCSNTKFNTQHTHSRKQSNHSFSRTQRPDTLIWKHCCKLTAILSAKRSTSGATSRDHGETTTVRPSVRSTVPVEPAGGGTADSCSAYHDQTAEVANRYWLHLHITHSVTSSERRASCSLFKTMFYYIFLMT